LYSETIKDTLAAAAKLGDISIQPNEAFKWNSQGLQIKIGSEQVTVQSVTLNIITLTAPLTTDHAANENMINVTNGSNPFSVSFKNDADHVGGAVKAAIRVEEGWIANGPVNVLPTGADASMFRFAPDNGGVPGVWMDWGTAITFASLTTKNTIFWIEPRCLKGEVPANNVSVKFRISCDSIDAA
jgi:hypothetical protein